MPDGGYPSKLHLFSYVGGTGREVKCRQFKIYDKVVWFWLWYMATRYGTESMMDLFRSLLKSRIKTKTALHQTK